MLHKLSLATRAYSEEELMQKIAIISREQDAAIKARLEDKARALANLRGIEIPIVERDVVNVPKATAELRAGARSATPDTIFMEDIANTRLSPKGKGPEFSKLREKAIQDEFGDVAKSKAKQLRHRTVGPLRRFWAGRNAFGKWPNRLALLGGLGAAGLGIRAYLNANKSPELPADDAIVEYWKGAGYVEDIASTPRPVSQPKVSPPSTKPPSALASSTRTPGAPGAPSPGAEGISGGSPSPEGGGLKAGSFQRRLQKQADDSIFPLVAGGAGGVGGFMLADKLLNPYLKNRENALLKEIAQKQVAVDRLRGAQKFSPFGAAAAGAILLAALAAAKARKSEAERQQAYNVIQNPLQAYDPSGAGFYPDQQVPVGSPQGFY